jgi:hypothetical protein
MIGKECADTKVPKFAQWLSESHLPPIRAVIPDSQVTRYYLSLWGSWRAIVGGDL